MKNYSKKNTALKLDEKIKIVVSIYSKTI